MVDCAAATATASSAVGPTELRPNVATNSNEEEDDDVYGGLARASQSACAYSNAQSQIKFGLVFMVPSDDSSSLRRRHHHCYMRLSKLS